jgi:hypothetical protein
LNSITVPWVVSWSDEQAFDVRPCRWAGGAPALWQRHAPGSGRPMFEDLHVTRARRAVAQFLCAVCGQPTDAGDRWWFCKGKTDLPRADGTCWPFATANSPLHRRCAELAAEACPHLSGQALTPQPFPMPSAIVAPTLTKAGGAIAATGFTLRPGQSVVGPLYLAWRETPVGVNHA